MKKGFLLGCIAVCALVLVPGGGLADELRGVPFGELPGGKFQIGKMKVIPELTVLETYDDNIYAGNGTNQQNEREESDWITQFQPGLTLDYALPGERGNIGFGYAGAYAYYADEDENDWQNHTGFLNVNYKAPGGLIFNLAERYSDAEDPYGSPDQYGIGVPKTERWNNDLKTLLGFEFSRKFRVIGRYNHYKQDYDALADFTQDYTVQRFGADLQMLVMPKTWAFLRYMYGEQDYYTHPAGMGVTDRNDADRDWHEVTAGLTWDSGAKLRGELLFGYAWYDFDNPQDPAGNLYQGKDTWVAGTNIQYQMREATRFTLGIARTVRTTGAASNEYFEDTSFSVGVVQGFTHRFFVKANLSYSLNTYNLPVRDPREDDNYYANVVLEYLLQDWLKAGVGYDWSEKESNYDANDYTKNRAWVFLKAKY